VTGAPVGSGAVGSDADGSGDGGGAVGNTVDCVLGCVVVGGAVVG
jgi:hypothetical protein